MGLRATFRFSISDFDGRDTMTVMYWHGQRGCVVLVHGLLKGLDKKKSRKLSAKKPFTPRSFS